MFAKQMLWVLAVVAVGMVFWAGSAQAALINVDFAQNTSNTYSGAAAVGADGDVWNAVNYGLPTDRPSAATYSPQVVNLLNSGGTGSGVTLTETWTGNNLVNEAGTGAFNATSYKDLMYDGVGYEYNITLTGLAAGTYDLYLYSPFGFSRYIVNGVNAPTKPYSGDPVLADHTIIVHPVVGSDGVLTIRPVDYNDHIDKLSGFQLTPEPATMALLGLGGLGVLLRRKRK